MKIKETPFSFSPSSLLFSSSLLLSLFILLAIRDGMETTEDGITVPSEGHIVGTGQTVESSQPQHRHHPTEEDEWGRLGRDKCTPTTHG